MLRMALHDARLRGFLRRQDEREVCHEQLRTVRAVERAREAAYQASIISMSSMTLRSVEPLRSGSGSTCC